jgi:hypothetical protein
MAQKFKIFSLVHITKDMPFYKEHFDNDFVGIVEGTYKQIYGGSDDKSYSIYKLNKDKTKIVDAIAWYEENQLTLLPKQDRLLVIELIDKYLGD